ncbi:hypothetical protein R1flu_025975 [Riccia fluitans]|uniref:Uncharacterized protein n=1 Tax=Riccia fluitans TaxID=41844 RepID=A0ABD1XEM0_9MARC
MSDQDSGDDIEGASPHAYEALRARNIAICKQKEHQILKDSGFVELREDHKHLVGDKDVGERSQTHQSSSVCIRSKMQPTASQPQRLSTDINSGSANIHLTRPFNTQIPPGYVMQNPNWGYSASHPNTWPQLPVDVNEARRFRCVAKWKFIPDMVERKDQGLKPCKLVVDSRGFIIDGKDEWYADLKSLCLNYLDLNLTHFSKKSSTNIRLVRTNLDEKYEYVGGDMSEDFVKGKILQILKGERHKLKLQWETIGEGKKDAPCSNDVESKV